MVESHKHTHYSWYTSSILILSSLVVSFGLWLLATSSAHAASYSVAAGTDTTATDGQCRLSEALNAISTQTAVNECPAGDGNDTITLPSGTITQTANLPTVTLQLGSTLTITGQSNGSSIIDGFDGTNNYAGFDFTTISAPGSFPNLTITDVTLTRHTDWAIRSGNINTTVERVRITNCVATSGFMVGIFMFANNSQLINPAPVNNLVRDVEITGCVVSTGQLFGIYDAVVEESAATTLVENVSIYQNTGGNLIGILQNVYEQTVAASGTITIRNVTVHNPGTNNTAAIANQAYARNNSTATATMTVENVTVVGNNWTANDIVPIAGGITNAAQETDPTATANATVTVRNSIIANNQGHDTTNVVSPMNCANSLTGSNGTATLTSLGNNLSDDSSCGTATTGDQYNVPAANITSTLGSLQNNGGFTPTMALLTGSPAIDAGATLASVPTDQRGIVRPQGSAYDIGAFELVSTTTPGGGSGSGGTSPTTRPTLANTGDNVWFVRIPATLAGISGIGLVVYLLKRRGVSG